MAEIGSSLEFGSLEKVKTIISEESKLLKDRNKILKIADTHGWDTVKEYDTDPLADNSKDANKLCTAIKRARYARKFKPYVSSTHGQGQVFLQGQQVNGFPLSFSFFPSLKCDLERLCKEHRSDILGKTNSIHRIMPSQSHVTPVTSKDTLLRTVHTEQAKSRPEMSVIQQQHSLPQQSPKSSRVPFESYKWDDIRGLYGYLELGAVAMRIPDMAMSSKAASTNKSMMVIFRSSRIGVSYTDVFHYQPK